MISVHYKLLLREFGTNKTPIDIIKKGAFGETYFNEVYSDVNGKWYRNSWVELQKLDDIDNNYCYSFNYYGD